jgi:hypothetical protein
VVWQGLTVDEKDKEALLKDFKDAEINSKLDMWFYALDQEAIWEEILDELSKIARIKQLREAQKKSK